MQVDKTAEMKEFDEQQASATVQRQSIEGKSLLHVNLIQTSVESVIVCRFVS